MFEENLAKIIKEKQELNLPAAVIKNYLREFLQLAVLEKIYSHPQWQKLIFTGGSCLRICYNLPRLSEDLDFDYLPTEIKKFSFTVLEKYLKETFKKDYGFSFLETKIQGNYRLYLKFPILQRLGMVRPSESDKLFVKIEITKTIAGTFQTELTPVSKQNFSFLVRHYNLSSLMSGKIAAVLERLWFKGEKSEIDIKGRDFYDLWWYLEQKVVPNWKRLEKITGIKTPQQLIPRLEERIEKVVTPQKLIYDLGALLENQEFAQNFAKNYKKFIKRSWRYLMA